MRQSTRILRFSRSYEVWTCVGVAAGAAFLFLYFRQLRLQKELRDLKNLIQQLQRDIAEAEIRLKSKRNRLSYSGYSSAVTASSGDDDDDFEDALAGGDTEPDSDEYNRQNSSDRMVQFASPVSTEAEIVANAVDEYFYSDIDQLLSGGKMEMDRAYGILQRQESRLSLKAEFQWRFSKASYNMANQAGDRGDAEQKKALMYKAKDAAQAALRLEPSCPDAHKWFAITLGCVGDYEATSEKIKNAVIIKDHIERAIKLNPSDPTPHHMLGRWCYSVYMLTWLERKAASAFFGSPPTSTAEEALEHFMEAENLNPGKWKENMLFIAKCLIEKKRYAEAGKWLRKAVKDLEQSSEDATVRAEIRNLVSKYGS